MSDHPYAEELSKEAITRDHWSAVYCPVPQAAPHELLKHAHWVAEYCYEAALYRVENPESRTVQAFEPHDWHRLDVATLVAHANAARERLEELERLDPSLERMNHRGVDYREDREWLERMTREGLSRNEDSGSTAADPREHDEQRQETRERFISDPSDKRTNVEITDRMERLLDTEHDNDRDMDRDDDFDIERDTPDGGHSRGR